MLRLYVISILVLLASIEVAAQQFGQFSQFALSKYEMNQAYGGMDRSLSVNLVSRNQWSDFTGRPSTTLINANLPLYRFNGAAGVLLKRESVGLLSQTSFRASYNYVSQLPFGLLSVSGTVGFLQVGLDGNGLRTPDGIYDGEIISHNDLLLSAINTSGTYGTWSLSALFRSNEIEAAFSVSNFASGQAVTGDFKSRINPEFNLYAQYNLSLTNEIKLMPSFLVKTDLVEIQSDVVVLAQYDRQYFGGLGLRGYNQNSLDAVSVILGYQISKHYRISYSYDIGLSSLARFHTGTHEFVINYNLAKPIGKRKEAIIIYSPRFL